MKRGYEGDDRLDSGEDDHRPYLLYKEVVSFLQGIVCADPRGGGESSSERRGLWSRRSLVVVFFPLDMMQSSMDVSPFFTCCAC